MRRETVNTLLALVGCCAWSMSACATSENAANEFDIYRVGASAGKSTYGFSGDADWALSVRTRLQLGGAYQHASDQSSILNVRQGHAGLEQRFNRFAVQLEADYRNDNSAIETTSLRARGDYRRESVSVGLALARRRIDVTFDLGDLLRQYVDATRHTYSTESALRLRYAPNAFAMYATGAHYDYDAALNGLGARLDISRVPLLQRQALQDRLDTIRAQLSGATLRSLRLAGHLVDYSAAVGIDYRAGDHLLNLEYAREREVLSETVIQSVEAGWVIPLGGAADLDLRVGGSTAENQDNAYYGGVTFTFYR